MRTPSETGTPGPRRKIARRARIGQRFRGFRCVESEGRDRDLAVARFRDQPCNRYRTVIVRKFLEGENVEEASACPSGYHQGSPSRGRRSRCIPVHARHLVHCDGTKKTRNANNGRAGSRSRARFFADAARQHNWRLSYRTSAHPPTLYRSIDSPPLLPA